MNPRDSRWLGGLGLVLAAGLVWYRDTSWLSNPADALPLAAGIPLAWWLGGPWRILQEPDYRGIKRVAGLGTIAFATGWVLSCITLLSVAWTVLAWCWVRTFYRTRRGRGGVWCLAVFSFPWLVIEWQWMGWWFRLSSAVAEAGFFNLLDMPVLREGTRLNVMGVAIQVEAACAGWNLLQLTLLAGLVMGVRGISSVKRFLVFTALLPALSWLANFIRILALTGIALSFDVRAADGVLHGITGLVVIAAVLVAARLLSILIDPPAAAPQRIIRAS